MARGRRAALATDETHFYHPRHRQIRSQNPIPPMLQAIRSKANSYIVKILFALLAAVFSLWGIGDIFRNWGVDTTVAEVGSMKITADQLNQTVQTEMQQLSNALGNNIDLAQAKKLGLVDSALQQMVNADLVDLEVGRVGLAVGNDVVRQAIVENPDFKGPSGTFDRARYAQLLAANQLTETQFETSLRQDIIRNQLTSALLGGVTPPSLLVDALYRSEAERRIAETVTLTPNAVPAPPAPTEQQLAAYHDSHQSVFRTPEERSFTIALLRVDDVAATIKVPEGKVQQEYQSRLGEFRTPEQRDVEQLLLPNEAEAKAAQVAIAAGKDFAAVAKAEANASTSDLGWVKRGDLPAQLAKVAFSLPQGKASEPVQTSFGWHILRVIGVKAAAQQPFSAVKQHLEQELARDQAADQISTIANHIDDALAGGDSFATVVQKFGLKTQKIANVDAQGDGTDGKLADLPKPSDGVLHAAFSTDAGQTSQLTELGDNGYFIVHVDQITPAAVQPLSTVRDKATALWQTDQRKQALVKLADAIVQEVKAGKSLQDVAAARKLKVTTTAPLPRTGGDPSVPPALLAAMFNAKKGGVVSAPSGENFVVAEVKTIEPADPTKNPAAVKALSDQIANDMRSDVMSAVDQALRAYFPVDINQTNLDRLL